jgi:hypothetical protein
MNATTHELLNLTSEELATLAELLESARTKLLVGIRHPSSSLSGRTAPPAAVSVSGGTGSCVLGI